MPHVPSEPILFPLFERPFEDTPVFVRDFPLTWKFVLLELPHVPRYCEFITRLHFDT